MKCYLGIFLIFFKRSCLFHSIPFLYFFALFTSEAFLISPCCSLELCIQIGLSFLFFFPLPFTSLIFSAIVRPTQTTIVSFCISFSWGWFWSPLSVQCYKPPSIFLLALCLSDLFLWIYLSLPLYNHKEFDLSQPKWPSVFPYFI